MINKPLQNFVTKIENKSLRWRILLYITLSLFFMILILLSIIRMNFSAITTLGDAYNSNAELSGFSEYLAETEKSLEQYVQYRTFESIDNFYSNRSKIEEYCENMQKKPSINEVLQKEYIVNQLCKSFIFYSSKTISAKRGNNSEEVNTYYKKTINCYNTLLAQILEYNKLLLKQNANTYAQNHEQIKFAENISIIFFIVLSLLIVILMYLSITSITKPLEDISNVALRVAKRDFDIPLFNKNTNNEIGNICRAFDRMIISIREYIDTIWEKARTEAELKEKEIEMRALYTDAQLRALQNQINPHFLFNTLNTGAQLAMMEGADKTCYFLEQVSDFFRYNIQKQNQSATIDEELGLVDNFVYIMKVRFGNRLTFIKNIPDQSFPQLIPTMTLQPLVENCLKHGLKNEQGEVSLNLDIDEQYINISISDNGSGMPDEIKEMIYKAVENNDTIITSENIGENHNGTGLLNVFIRLKMFYHKDNLFEITANKDGIGTRFLIRIPKNV